MKLNFALSALLFGLVSADEKQKVPSIPYAYFTNTTYLKENLVVKDNVLTHLGLPNPSCNENSTVLAYIREDVADKDMYPLASLYPNFVAGQESYIYKYNSQEQTSGIELQALPDYPEETYTILSSILKGLKSGFSASKTKLITGVEFPGQYSPVIKDNIFVLITQKVDSKTTLFFVPPEVAEKVQKKFFVYILAKCDSQVYSKEINLTVTDSALSSTFAYGSLLLASLVYAIL